MIPGTGRRAVRTVAVVGMVLGAQLAALGFVGIVAAAPRNNSLNLEFPTGNGTAIVQLTPAPTWGSRAFTLSVPGRPNCNSNGGSGSSCPSGSVTVSISSCVDVTCRQASTWFDWTLLVGVGGVSTPLTTMTTFLLSVSHAQLAPVVVKLATSWWASGVFQTGGNSWSIVFTGVLMSGLFVLACCLGLRRYIDRHPLSRLDTFL